MGFFSDLKEDLSQAVNELMPEDELNAAVAAAAPAAEEQTAVQDAEELPAADEALDSLDLSSMLDRLEEPDTAEEPLEEAVISADGEETQEAEPIPELAEEPAPEIEEEPAAETEEAYEADNMISEMSGEEEEVMEEQTQVQAQTNRVAVDETAVVTEGMTITGDIISEGSMELIGTVNGNLDILGKLNITGTIQGDSKAAEIFAEGAKITGEVNSQGSVKIGQSSVVIGNITASSAVIAGAVKGDIDVRGPVILDTTAIVMGNIKSKSVQINNGAVIEGMCSQCYADVNPTSFFEEFKKKKG